MYDNVTFHVLWSTKNRFCYQLYVWIGLAVFTTSDTMRCCFGFLCVTIIGIVKGKLRNQSIDFPTPSVVMKFLNR